jgi:UDP-2,4-diacetamido-2,4,6-trideoxy-beta-L-altropyranose hydrolase
MVLVHRVFLKVWSDDALNMIVRRASDQDCSEIHEWRNDVTTRQMSLNGEIIDYENHKSWFYDMLRSNKHVALVGEINSKKIGIVYFKEHNEQVFVSINLNPSFRGAGLSSEFLAKSLEFYLKKRQNNTQILAEIKCDNFKSERIFKNNNFVFFSNHDGVNTFMWVNLTNKVQKDV